MSVGFDEMFGALVFTSVGLALQALPLVLVVVLWRRNRGLAERVEALEKRLADR